MPSESVTTLSKIKTDLRISHNLLDADLTDNIEACRADLRICGIVDPDDADPSILAAIKLYCRANFTDDMTKHAAYRERYERLKSVLMSTPGVGKQYD